LRGARSGKVSRRFLADKEETQLTEGGHAIATESSDLSINLGLSFEDRETLLTFYDFLAEHWQPGAVNGRLTVEGAIRAPAALISSITAMRRCLRDFRQPFDA
jgi:hypothetical protein